MYANALNARTLVIAAAVAMLVALGVAAGSVGYPGAAESHQYRDRCSYHQRPYV